MALFTFVKILNSSDTRRSYPYDESPYEITPSRTCFSLKGEIIPCSTACWRIHLSLFIATPTVLYQTNLLQNNFFTNARDVAK
jgi:hypothetical protein